MSGDINQFVNFSPNDYIENADLIRDANQANDRKMRQLFADLLAKTEEINNRLLVSEAKVDSLKTVVAKQIHEINWLHRKLNDVSRKCHMAELMAQVNANKYNRLHGKLKGIILESACESGADGEGAV